MQSLIFDVQNVTYTYSAGVAALNNVSLQIMSGERIAILGANGSGKSTLLRILDGLYFPTSGSVRVWDSVLSEEQLEDDAWAFDFRRRVALVFQNPDVQLFNPTVFDEVAFGPLQLGWPKDQIRQRVQQALELMEITHLKDRSPHRLSGGEKKRVALASVLILEPEVLLMDEPTAALDPKSQSQVVDFLAGWAGSGRTVITATHDLDVIGEIADRCFVFQQGAIIAQGTPDTLLNDHDLLHRTNLVNSHRQIHYMR